MTYYLIETKYTGANADAHMDEHTVCVTREAPTDGDGDIVTQGTYRLDEYAYRVHGAYDTEGEAGEALVGEFGDGDWSNLRATDEDHVYLVGRYCQLGVQATREEWAEWRKESGVTADTSDAQIDEWVDIWCDNSRQDAEAELDADTLRSCYMDARAELIMARDCAD